MTLNLDVLKAELAKKDLELTKVTPGKQANTFTISATKLHPVQLTQSDPVYIPVAVNLSVTLDNFSHIRKSEEVVNPKQIEDSENFVKTLLANNQIGGLAGQSKSNPTHQIELNNKGQQVITRRNFSAY